MTDHSNASPLILFVDDEATALKYFDRAVGAIAPVITANSVEEGKKVLDQHSDSLIVLVSDQRMPGEYGNELLEYAKDKYPHIVRILTTAYSELENTVDAVNQGQIHRYIQKPWDISLLRTELKQSLEFGNLRKEHAFLLNEKLFVRQKQTISVRIGVLNTLAMSLSKASHLPIKTYLSAALLVAHTPAEPNWLLMDYSDLVSEESYRAGEFGRAVQSKLKQLEAEYTALAQTHLQKVLEKLLPETIAIQGDSVIFKDERCVVEFLETPSYQFISDAHIAWFAFLIWLDRTGYALEIKRLENNVLQGQFVSQAADALPQKIELAHWIEQF